MKDPMDLAKSDQSAAAVRNALDALNINTADPEQMRIVRATVYVVAKLELGSFTVFVEALNTLAEEK